MRIAVLGTTGRMGTAVTRAIASHDTAELSGALAETGHPMLGADAGTVAGTGPSEITIVDDPSQAVDGADVAIDFTLPEAAQANIAACVAQGCALVIGTTGLSASQHDALHRAGESVGIVYGRNMSVGINVFTELARLAARFLGPDWEVEISEAHHRHKLDAPSGTALQLGEAVAAERGQSLDDVACYDRHGATGARSPETIGFTSLRAGSLIGEHNVLLASDTELLQLQHRALDRATFAEGALRAAEWIVEQPPGLYGMADVLGFGD